MNQYVEKGKLHGLQLAAEMLVYLFAAECVFGGSGRLLAIGGISIRMIFFALAFIATLPFVWIKKNELIRNPGIIAVVIRIKSNCVTEYGGIDYADVYDYNFYVATYPALAEKYANDPAGALKHFVEVGVPSGYQAIADFNVLGYAKANGRLRDIFGSDLMSYVHHYIDYGKQEGRNGLGNSAMEDYETVYNGVDYSAVYDYNYYTTNNYEVFEKFNVDDAKVLEYFVTVGMVQGQQGCEKFNPVSYAYEYSDVRDRCRNSLKYYMDKGGFDYTPFYFDYIQVGKAAGYNGTGCHSMKGFITSYGGTDYSSVYDYNAYCLNNKDIFALLGVDDAAVLEHFVLYGQEEGRIATN